jgi:hypothetical protein
VVVVRAASKQQLVHQPRLLKLPGLLQRQQQQQRQQAAEVVCEQCWTSLGMAARVGRESSNSSSRKNRRGR